MSRRDSPTSQVTPNGANGGWPKPCTTTISGAFALCMLRGDKTDI